MPITLTTPYKDYTQVKIVDVREGVLRKMLFVKFQYGDTVDGIWVPGVILPEEELIRNAEAVTDGEQEIAPADPAYDDLVNATAPGVTFEDKSADPRWKKVTISHPTHGDLDVYVQLTYCAIGDGLYQYALDEGWYIGTIAEA